MDDEVDVLVRLLSLCPEDVAKLGRAVEWFEDHPAFVLELGGFRRPLVAMDATEDTSHTYTM